MTADETLGMARRVGIRLSPRGDRLHVDAPAGSITPELRDALARYKSDILARLQPASALVTFRGGFVADSAIVQRLLDIEARGCSFRLEEGGRFRVVPADRLTPDDLAFLRERRDEARRVLEYEADDSHMFTA